MDLERPEAAAALLLEVVDDQLSELRVIGPAEPFEKITSLVGVERLGDEPVERPIGETGQVLVAAKGVGREGLAADAASGRARVGKEDLASSRLALLVEMEIELLAEVVERLFGMIRVRQQRLPVLDLADAIAGAMLFDPAPQQLFDLVELPRVLRLEALIVVGVDRARDEFRQRGGAVGRPTKNVRQTRSPVPRRSSSPPPAPRPRSLPPVSWFRLLCLRGPHEEACDLLQPVVCQRDKRLLAAHQSNSAPGSTWQPADWFPLLVLGYHLSGFHHSPDQLLLELHQPFDPLEIELAIEADSILRHWHTLRIGIVSFTAH